jgi:outer membrane protein insertion porin family
MYRVALLLLLLVTRASAQALIEDTLTAQKFDPATCIQAPVAAPTTPTALAAPPVTWTDFELVGSLSENATTVRALFEPTMRRHRALTDDARSDIRRIASAFGYHLVGLSTRESAQGTLAVVHVAPLPLVRRIDVKVEVDSILDTLLDEEIRRRMRVRAGSYLPWTPKDRACDLHDETRRIEEFLRDEGFIDARARIEQTLDRGADAGLRLDIVVDPGPSYSTGRIDILGGEPSEISEDEIRKVFRHDRFCVPLLPWCVGEARFRREQHQRDVQTVVDMYRRRGGYPSVRVRTDFDPQTSFDRRSKRVNFTITIDQRRKVETVFEGHSESIKLEELRAQLTFDQAQSADDVEVAESARELTGFLQSKGYFDARVTWTRERFERFDRVIFRIEQGETRLVRSVQFVGNRALSDDSLRDAIGTSAVKLSTSLLGRTQFATSARLSADVDALVDLYRRSGYREARVTVSAATEPAALGDAAMTAALALADRGNGLYVRFAINEGSPTLLTQVEVTIGKDGAELVTDDQKQLCASVLADLARFYREPQLAKSAAPTRCIALAANLKYREAEAFETREQLKDRMFSAGRPRAKVSFEVKEAGPRRMTALYTLTDIQQLRVGKVVIRGNFHTHDFIVDDELHFKQGDLLTKDRLAEGARRLRNTGLFDAVNIAMPDLDGTSEGEVNAVIEVTERYDRRFGLDLEGGYSSYSGAFLKLVPTVKNILGVGISFEVPGTIGVDVVDAFEGDLTIKQLSVEPTLRIPPYLSKYFLFPFGGSGSGIPEVATELSGFHRQQDTERFGEIKTTGATLSFARQFARPRTDEETGRAITVGVHYDFRLRERPVDVLRPAGADDDQTQVPISTRLSSVGVSFEYENRTDRNGTLSPLAPERGQRLELQAAFYEPWLLGQDMFVKISAAASKYHLVGDNLLLRADARYDQGFPLGGAVLLPEVERYFAGGDSTVRGYEDERLATEVIQVAVPPFDNVSQIRVLPAGGNIRVLGSLDAQLRIYKVLATAVFVDAGMISNTWSSMDRSDIHPSVGIAVARIVTPFGIGALERAIPLNPNLGDNPRGRWHFSFAARAQF